MESDQLILQLAYSPDGKTLAIQDYDGKLTLWNATTLQMLDKQLGVYDSVSFAFSLDGNKLISIGANGINVWDMESYLQIGQIPFDNSDAGGFWSIGSNGAIFASGDLEGHIHFWDMKTLLPIRGLLFDDGGSVRSIDFIPDGKLMASGNDGGLIHLRDLNTGQVIGQPLQPTTRLLNSVVSFNQDGHILASGYISGTIEGAIVLWDTSTGLPIGQPLTGYKLWKRVDQVTSVDFSPDGKILASISRDGLIVLWDIDPQSWIRKSCQRMGRNFTRAEWAKYFPNEEYRKTCDQWPLEPEVTITPVP